MVGPNNFRRKAHQRPHYVKVKEAPVADKYTVYVKVPADIRLTDYAGAFVLGAILTEIVNLVLHHMGIL